MLKQLAKDLWQPIHDDQLAGHLRLSVPLVRGAVTDIQALEVEAIKGAPDVRMVIDADHHLALAPPHEVGHAFVLLKRKVHTVADGLPVRRIHVEERMRSIVALGTGKPGQMLHVRAGKPLPCRRQVFLNTQKVDCWTCGGGTECLTGELGTERMLLQVKEPRGSLDIGQRFRARHLLPLEDLAGAKRPFELAHELLQVVLHNAIKGDKVTVEIV